MQCQNCHYLKVTQDCRPMITCWQDRAYIHVTEQLAHAQSCYTVSLTAGQPLFIGAISPTIMPPYKHCMVTSAHCDLIIVRYTNTLTYLLKTRPKCGNSPIVAKGDFGHVWSLEQNANGSLCLRLTGKLWHDYLLVFYSDFRSTIWVTLLSNCKPLKSAEA